MKNTHYSPHLPIKFAVHTYSDEREDSKDDKINYREDKSEPRVLDGVLSKTDKLKFIAI